MSRLVTKRLDINGKIKEIQYLVTSDISIYFNSEHITRGIGYGNAQHAIEKHVSPGETIALKTLLEIEQLVTTDPCVKGGVRLGVIMLTFKGTIEILHSSKQPAAKEISIWLYRAVFSDLPLLYSPSKRRERKERQGRVVRDENTLHFAIVGYLKSEYPHVAIIPGLGENQDTQRKRMSSKGKGYESGQCDLLVTNYHLYYRGLCMELKTPKGTGKVSTCQRDFLEKYRKMNLGAK